MMDIEQARWYDWRRDGQDLPEAGRIYYGHETCERLLPSRPKAMDFANRVASRPGTKISLVTPFLTPKGLSRALALVRDLLDRLGELEVVCSDWGLLHCLGRHGLATPVLGRLLTAQITDPRIIRIMDPRHAVQPEKTIRHMDGTICILRSEPASAALQSHYRSCWVDKPEAIALLSRCGIGRCELSNAAQGIELDFAGLRYTLHVPDVLVTVMRLCPGDGEDFNKSPQCPCPDVPPGSGAVKWSHPTLAFDLFRRDNALYYQRTAYPDNLHTLPVDRIVYPQDGVAAPSFFNFNN